MRTSIRPVIAPALRRLRRAVGVTLLTALVLAAVGQVVRDRGTVAAFLFYLPLLPLALAALTWDLLLVGRALSRRRSRFVLTALGATAAAWSCAAMTGRGPPAVSAGPAGDTLTLLHWNVQWGDDAAAPDGDWAKIRPAIRRRSPDVLVLSEAPSDENLRRLLADLGPAWTSVQVRHAPGSPNWFKLVVCSRWPVRLERRVALTHGAGMCAVVMTPGGAVRVLVVDGHSDPRLPRATLLGEVARECRRAAKRGEPVDVIAGDFNAPSRAVGFDAFYTMAGGYELASHASSGWRASWPAALPLYDIDHVWVSRRRWAVLGCELFANAGTDHRGQVVRLGTPGGGITAD